MSAQGKAESKARESKEQQQCLRLIKEVGNEKFSALRDFMLFIWGSQERFSSLYYLLHKKSIAENVIMTRGRCSDVKQALTWTPLGPAFSQVIDTQGARFQCREVVDKGVKKQKWKALPTLPPEEYRSGRRSWVEIEKDVLIVKDFLPKAENKDNPIRQIIYVDDSPEVAEIQNLPESRKDFIEVIVLKHEADGGITAPQNFQQYKALNKHLDKAPANSVCVIWDFDCTLSAKHLYKTWQCARTGQNDPKWGKKLMEWAIAVVRRRGKAREKARKEREKEQQRQPKAEPSDVASSAPSSSAPSSSAPSSSPPSSSAPSSSAPSSSPPS